MRGRRNHHFLSFVFTSHQFLIFEIRFPVARVELADQCPRLYQKNVCLGTSRIQEDVDGEELKSRILVVNRYAVTASSCHRIFCHRIFPLWRRWDAFGRNLGAGGADCEPVRNFGSMYRIPEVIDEEYSQP
jgi:hypothetical protein